MFEWWSCESLFVLFGREPDKTERDDTGTGTGLANRGGKGSYSTACEWCEYEEGGVLCA